MSNLAYALLLSFAVSTQGVNSPSKPTAPEQGQSADKKQERGSLRLRSTPSNAAVEIDGKSIGNTPLAVDLESGNHVITVSKAGYQPWKAEITIRNGERAGIGARLRRPGETSERE